MLSCSVLLPMQFAVSMKRLAKENPVMEEVIFIGLSKRELWLLHWTPESAGQQRSVVGLLFGMPAAAASQEALPLPSHTGTQQSPRDCVLVPSCDTAGKWHTIPAASCVTACSQERNKPWVKLGCCHLWCRMVQNSRSIRQNPYYCHLCLAAYKYQKKGPETSGHYFVSELLAHGCLGWWVCDTQLLQILWVKHCSISSLFYGIILHLFRDYCFCTSCNTTAVCGAGCGKTRSSFAVSCRKRWPQIASSAGYFTCKVMWEMGWDFHSC